MKHLRFILTALSAVLISGSSVIAQPAHTPVTSYVYNAPAGYARYTLPGAVSHSSADPFDVAVTSSYHFSSGTSIFSSTQKSHMVLCKINAATGAPVAMSNVNIGTLLGLPSPSNDVCKGMLLQEAENRVYLFGTTQNPGETPHAVILCYNMTTMAVETSFSFGDGAQVTSFNTSEIIDADLYYNTGVPYIVILMNEKDANNKNYLNVVIMAANGGWSSSEWISNTGYECYGKRIRNHVDNDYLIAGKAVNANGSSIPMLWDLRINGTEVPFTLSVLAQTADNFSQPAVGFGEFIDVGRTYGPPTIIAIGNNTSGNGIWARYKFSDKVGNIYYPDQTFKNGASLPGTVSGIKFSRCLVQPDGYTVTLGAAGQSGRLGYVNTTGTAYVTTRNLSLDHPTGLNKNSSGNVIVGGCYLATQSTGKFTSYTGGSYWPWVNKMQNPEAEVNEADGLSVDVFSNRLICNGATAGKAEIYDMNGKIIMSIDAIKQQGNIDISTLKTGAYLIRLTDGDKKTTKKFMKQ